MLEKLRHKGHKGLTFVHTALITNLAAEGTRITELAERAGMSKQSMSQLAKDLEHRGYVRRVPDPADRRAVLIQFTGLGQRLLADAREAKRVVECEYETILGPKDVKRLTALLYQLVQRLE